MTLKEAVLETATYGSEYSSARTFIEQIFDLRIKLRHSGVPFRKNSCIFGDKKSLIDSSMTSHSKTRKTHVAFYFHRVRETIAVGIISYCFIQGSLNITAVLRKHWSLHDVWCMMQLLFFLSKEILWSYLRNNKLRVSSLIFMLAFFDFIFYAHIYFYCKQV